MAKIEVMMISIGFGVSSTFSNEIEIKMALYLSVEIFHGIAEKLQVNESHKSHEKIGRQAT